MYQSYTGKLIACLAFIVLSVTEGYSQYPLPIETGHSCTFSGEPVASNLYEFKSSNEANGVIRQIMEVVGLKPRFEIKAANVSNAAAVIYDNKRYILYSQNFISQIHRATQTDWAAISILAHEIGHHLNGHTLDFGGSRPSSELEADEFSGFVLRKMGASLPEAQAAMNVLAQEEGSPTHPGKSARLEAIAVGWKQADETMSGEVIARGQESPRQEPVARQTPVTREPVSQPQTEEAETTIDKKSLVGKVVFHASPSSDYYLTKQYNLIKVTAKGVEVVGKIAKSDQEEYPYIIYNQNKKYVYVAKNGDIYDADGDKVGYATNI